MMHNSQTSIDLSPTFDVDDLDREDRVQMVARAIPNDVDLDDPSDVIATLFAARLCAADFSDVLDDAIAEAREMRAVR